MFYVSLLLFCISVDVLHLFVAVRIFVAVFHLVVIHLHLFIAVLDLIMVVLPLFVFV